MKHIQNPLLTALLLQLIGVVFAIKRGCLDEAIIASVLFWILVIKMSSRADLPYTKVDVSIVRFGLLFLLVIVIGLWGW
jgi:hypothetical protein